MQNQRLRKAAALTREWTPDGPHGVRNDDLALAREPQARSTLSFASPGPRPPLPPASRDSETSARLREPRQQVLELRQLHLEVAVARGRMLREDVEDGLRAVYARGRARRPDRVGKPLAHAQGRRVAVPQAGVGVRVHVKETFNPILTLAWADRGVRPRRAHLAPAHPPAITSSSRRARPGRTQRPLVRAAAARVGALGAALPWSWSWGREATPPLRAPVHRRHRRRVATCDNAPALYPVTHDDNVTAPRRERPGSST